MALFREAFPSQPVLQVFPVGHWRPARRVPPLHWMAAFAVFVGFAWLVLGEKLSWNYAVSFGLILAAVYFATAFKPGGTTPSH